MRKAWRAVKVLLIAAVVGVAGLAATLYLMVRHRPGLYRPPTEVRPDERQRDFEAFEAARQAAEEHLHAAGDVTLSLTADQINAALAQQQRDPAWRDLSLPVDLRNLQVVIQPGRMVVLGEVPTRLGPVIVSASVAVLLDEGGRLRLAVEDLRAGSLAVSRGRAARLAEQVEALLSSIDLKGGARLRVTEVVLGEGVITVRGVKERA